MTDNAAYLKFEITTDAMSPTISKGDTIYTSDRQPKGRLFVVITSQSDVYRLVQFVGQDIDGNVTFNTRLNDETSRQTIARSEYDRVLFVQSVHYGYADIGPEGGAS